jgi:hypothetical protein
MHSVYSNYRASDNYRPSDDFNKPINSIQALRDSVTTETKSWWQVWK